MAGFVDVVLRGLILLCTSFALGGVAWLRLVRGVDPHAKPDADVRASLRLVATGALAAAAAQVAVMAVALGALGHGEDAWPLGPYFGTTFAQAGLVRVGLAIAVAALALRLGRRPAGPAAWHALTLGAVALVATSAVVSHAVARVEHRALLLALDAAHQMGAAVWVGALGHLTLQAARRRRALDDGLRPPTDREVIRRFSRLALVSMAVIVVAGIVLTTLYVGDPAALLGTAYGVMVVSKVLILTVALGLAFANFRAVRRAVAADLRLLRFVEVELGLGATILFAAASLTSLPPAVDVTVDRATVAEVAARFTPAPPRLSSPPIGELLERADPLMAPTGKRDPVERAWSEYNHHWAGLFVATMGVLAALERLGVRAARHWPLVFLGLAAFLFVRNDPRAWPLGPAGFWESLTLPDVLQHRSFVLLIVAFAVFEWAVRTGRLPSRPWAYVFPLLCAVGGGLLLTHSHAMFNLKEEFLTEVTHAPLGILGAFAGWARWIELRLPGSGRAPGWIWVGCLTAVGLLLLFYREG
jgi:putative copper resistance protein D